MAETCGNGELTLISSLPDARAGRRLLISNLPNAEMPRVLDTPLKVDAEQLLDGPGLCTRGAHRRQLRPRALCRLPRDGRCAALGAEPGDARTGRAMWRCHPPREGGGGKDGLPRGCSGWLGAGTALSGIANVPQKCCAHILQSACAGKRAPPRVFAEYAPAPAPRSPTHTQGPLWAPVCADARTRARTQPGPACHLNGPIQRLSLLWPLFIASSVIPPWCWEWSQLGRKSLPSPLQSAAPWPQVGPSARTTHASILHPRGGGHRGLRCGPSPQERTPAGAAFLVLESATEQQ